MIASAKPLQLFKRLIEYLRNITADETSEPIVLQDAAKFRKDTKTTKQVMNLMRISSHGPPIEGYALHQLFNKDTSLLRNMTNPGSQVVCHADDRSHFGRTKQRWTWSIKNVVMWGNLSRGIYKPYTDIIGGNSCEHGYLWLREQMIEGREPVHMRDHSVV